MSASTTSCDGIIERLVAALQADFSARAVDDSCVIVTPFALPDMAALELWVEPQGRDYRLTDAGQTLAELFVSGLTIENNPVLTGEVRRIARNYAIQFTDGALMITAPAAEIGPAAQRLINAMQAVSYLIYRRGQRARRTFNDEVEQFLIENRVSYMPDQIVKGQASTHHIPFYMNENRHVLLEPVSAASQQSARDKAKKTAYKWTDIKRVAAYYRAVVILDDRDEREHIWSDDAEALRPLTEYSDFVMHWSTERRNLLALVKPVGLL